MNRQKIKIWGREFLLDVTYDCYPGEEILAMQKEALERILVTPTVIDESRKAVDKYVLANNSFEVGTVIDNIFKYVMPKSLFIPRTKKCYSIAIMCDYKFDPEHGLAVVFENEQLKTVGVQDIIL